MRAPPCRKFTLIDAMILIAATALGLAKIRLFFMDREAQPGLAAIVTWWITPFKSEWTPWGIARWIRNDVEVAMPLFAAWSLALLVIRLRRPRPTFRRVARQFGMVASGSAMLAVLVG